MSEERQGETTEQDPPTSTEQDLPAASEQDPPASTEQDPSRATNDEPAESPKSKSSWQEKEIARLRARVRDLRGENETLKKGSPTPSPTPANPNAEFERLVNQEVARRAPLIAQVQEFNRACDAAAAKGRASYPDFDAKLRGLLNVVDLTDQTQSAAYNNFLSAAIETGDAPRLIYELGSDPNKASTILAMSPVKMAVELTKMASPRDGNEGREETRAERPITPVNRANSNRNPISPDDPERADNLTTAEWMARRNKQLEERFGGRRVGR